jgi:hypothetical protein
LVSNSSSSHPRKPGVGLGNRLLLEAKLLKEHSHRSLDLSWQVSQRNLDYSLNNGWDSEGLHEKMAKRWLDPDEVPDNYSSECVQLAYFLFKDQDVDVEEMMVRTPLLELYKYLKQHYWLKVHNKELENATHVQSAASHSTLDSIEEAVLLASECSVDEGAVETQSGQPVEETSLPWPHKEVMELSENSNEGLNSVAQARLSLEARISSQASQEWNQTAEEPREDENDVVVSDWLKWWRKNGKRLVDEARDELKVREAETVSAVSSLKDASRSIVKKVSNNMVSAKERSKQDEYRQSAMLADAPRVDEAKHALGTRVAENEQIMKAAVDEKKQRTSDIIGESESLALKHIRVAEAMRALETKIADNDQVSNVTKMQGAKHELGTRVAENEQIMTAAVDAEKNRAADTIGESESLALKRIRVAEARRALETKIANNDQGSNVTKIPGATSTLAEKRQRVVEARRRALQKKAGDNVHKADGIHTYNAEESHGPEKVQITEKKISFSEARLALEARVNEKKRARNRNENVLKSVETRKEKLRKAAAEQTKLATKATKEETRKVEMKNERLAEAHRLAEKKTRAREARLALETRLAEETREVQNRKVDVDVTENNDTKCVEHSYSAPASQEPNKQTSAEDVPDSRLTPQMIEEIQRLSHLIWRYEKKLEVICKSLISIAHKGKEDDQTVRLKTSPLPELYNFVTQQDWYKRHADENSHGAPSMLFTTRKEESDSQKGLTQSLTVTQAHGDSVYTLTSAGETFLKMDGPVEADIGRFLSSLQSDEQHTLYTIKTKWCEVARVSGDAQSTRISDKVQDLMTLCLDSRLVE